MGLCRSVVPASRKLLGGLRLLRVDSFKKGGVNRSAVMALSVAFDLDCLGELVFVACHDVHKVSDGLRCVSVSANVNVDSTSAGRAALPAALAEGSQQSLQKLHVLVVQDRCDHLALAAVGACDADILLELPLAALCVPCAPGAVAVAVVGVLEAVGAEEVGGCLCRCAAGDAVHLDLNSEGLCLCLCDLLVCSCAHCSFLLKVCCGFSGGVPLSVVTC